MTSPTCTPTVSRSRPAASTARIWTALTAVYLIWGSTYLAIRISVETLPPFVSSALRFGAAGVVLAALLLLRRGWAALRVTRRQLGSAALVGVLLLVGGNAV